LREKRGRQPRTLERTAVFTKTAARRTTPRALREKRGRQPRTPERTAVFTKTAARENSELMLHGEKTAAHVHGGV
jgi:hypothetical protein